MRDLVRMSDIIRIYNNYDCDKAREEVIKLPPIDMIEELDKITASIDFEEKWLLDVYAKEYRVNANDIKIAMNGIRSTISKLKGENNGNDI